MPPDSVKLIKTEIQTIINIIQWFLQKSSVKASPNSKTFSWKKENKSSNDSIFIATPFQSSRAFWLQDISSAEFSSQSMKPEGVSSTMTKVEIYPFACKKFLTFDVKNVPPFWWGKFNQSNLHTGQFINYKYRGFLPYGTFGTWKKRIKQKTASSKFLFYVRSNKINSPWNCISQILVIVLKNCSNEIRSNEIHIRQELPVRSSKYVPNFGCIFKKTGCQFHKTSHFPNM